MVPQDPVPQETPPRPSEIQRGTHLVHARTSQAGYDAPSVQSLLRQWRARILRPLILTGAVLGSGAGAIFGYQQAAQQSWPVVALTGSMMIAIWVAALSRRLSDEGRIGLTLGVLYTAGTLALVTMGLCSESMLGMLSFVSMSALLVGFRRARWAYVIVVVTVAAAGWAFVHGNLTLAVPNPAAPDDAWNWFRSALFAAGVIAAVSGGTSFLLRELVTTLKDRTDLIQKLRDETLQRERTRAQLVETQERLLHAHKLEVVGRLAGGIAHDFNNTLTVILSYGELIKSRLGRDNPTSELADQVIHAAEQGGDLTKQLLTFTRRQIVKPRTVDVQQILRNTERALTRLVPRSIHIRRVESAEELYVTIDPTQLQQAILNLALNARDAMPDGGDLFLEASSCDLREPGELPLLRGHYVLIRVRDTGTGMPPETLSRLFEPFFTTKEPGRGTGLGLSNVRETTDAAGGHVGVHSELGRGSELTLYLPRADALISGVESTQPASSTHHHTLLVVDDEPQIREVIRTMLVDNEYVVRTADSARHALEILRTEPIDLVCTDLVMPEMSGSKLIDELKRLRPRLPIVVCSAYGTDDDVSRRVTRGEILFLSKPFTRKELLDVVGKALAPVSNGQPLAAG
ncbi:MAG: integral rane sensor hybrid histidine kinase [Myxococcaceae bacterium]|nr:integral rane sensor hybrid histidine kinase [Myxococcaceae bacterium]